MFMASAHVEWAPFAREMGWPVQPTSRKYPVGEWVKHKKDQLADEQGQVLASMVFSEKTRWHEEVLKTLKDYPEANNVLLSIIKKRLSDIVRGIRQDEQFKDQPNYKPQFDQVKNKDLLGLAAALKTLTESRHKSLLLDKWSFGLADKHVEESVIQDDEHDDSGWRVEIMGGPKTSAEMERMLSDWYDRPDVTDDFQRPPDPNEEDSSDAES